MNNSEISLYIVQRCTLSLKIPCLERKHRDADRINRSCLEVCVRLSLQISLSYAIFIIMIFFPICDACCGFCGIARCTVLCSMPHQVPKPRRYICN